jgi:hypothetical protein
MRSPYNSEYQGTNRISGLVSSGDSATTKINLGLGQMNRHFERLGAFCALQSGMVS